MRISKTEKRIHDLHEQAKKVHFYAVARMSHAASVFLWPYALYYVTKVRNKIPHDVNYQSPVQTLTRVKVILKLNTVHTFGCPVYQLNTEL